MLIIARRILRSTRGTMALTLSQAFLGALTAGIGLSRGIEADLGFHVESLVGESNYASSRVGAGHARSSNAIADNNVVSVAAMAPRLAVEADNITMDENAKIACPQIFNPKMRIICDQYTANKPRAKNKLDWIRDKQKSLWGSLEQLSGNMDKVAGAQAREDVTSNVKKMDPQAKMSFNDPTQKKSTWGKKNSSTACSLAKKDANKSQMVGHAFPQLMPNLLDHLPKALVSTLPGVMCKDGAGGGGGSGGASSGGAGGGGSSGGGMPSLPSMPQMPSSGDGSTPGMQAEEECDRIEQEMKDQIAFGQANAKPPVFSSDVEPFVRCFDPAKKVRCTFDRGACMKEKEEGGEESFIKSLGLSKMPDLGGLGGGLGGGGGGSTGGATRAPAASNPNESDDFRACSSASRAADSNMQQINDAVKTLITFSASQKSGGPLGQSASRESCGKWYFPNSGPSGNTPKAEQPFVGAWKHALVAPRGKK
jgi:uncharacterized membrane protein YgcG